MDPLTPMKLRARRPTIFMDNNIPPLDEEPNQHQLSYDNSIAKKSYLQRDPRLNLQNTNLGQPKVFWDRNRFDKQNVFSNTSGKVSCVVLICFRFTYILIEI